MNPVVLLEDHWMAQGAIAGLEEQLGTSVELVEDFAALANLLDRLAAVETSAEPVVILDPGTPGVCRLDAVRRSLQLEPRARIILWSASTDPSFLASALLDGALGAVHKHKSVGTLALAVERAGRGRFSCEPEVAQAIADLIDYLARCKSRMESTGNPHVWTYSQLLRMEIDPEWSFRLDELAAGEALVDDRWFAACIRFLQSVWLDWYLKRTLIALAVTQSREQAANELGTPLKTVHGYCSRLAALLIPTQYPADEIEDRAQGLTLASWIIRNHAGCLLSDADHISLVQPQGKP